MSYTMTLDTAIRNHLITSETLFEYLNIDNMPTADVEYLKSFILNQFGLREIGAETPDRFTRFFSQIIQENSPEYSRLYNALLTTIQPYVNTIISHTINETISDTKHDDTEKTITDILSATDNTVKTATTEHATTEEKKNQDTPFTQQLSPATNYMSEYQGASMTDNIDLSDNESRTSSGTKDTTAEESTDGTYGRNRTVTQADNDLTGMTQAEAFSLYRKNIITLNNLWIAWLQPAFMNCYE